jgi:hypothetical protein
MSANPDTALSIGVCVCVGWVGLCCVGEGDHWMGSVCVCGGGGEVEWLHVAK